MTDPTTDVPVERPNPLDSAAKVATAIAGSLGAIVGLAIQFGLLSAAQGQAVTDIGQALPGWLIALGSIAAAVIPLLSALAASFSTAKTGSQAVTPNADPRDIDGHKLVRADGLPLGGR